MRRRRNDAGQRMHSVTARRAVAEVGSQRRGHRAGVGGGATVFELAGDELAHVGGLHLRDHHGSVSEPLQQQALHDANTRTTCLVCEPSYAAHVFVEATQFLGDGAGCHHGLDDDTLLAQYLQEVAARGAEVTVNPCNRSRAVAARQVVGEESADGHVIDVLDSETTQVHPPREVRDANKVPVGSALRVAAQP